MRNYELVISRRGDRKPILAPLISQRSDATGDHAEGGLLVENHGPGLRLIFDEWTDRACTPCCNGQGKYCCSSGNPRQAD